MKDLVNEYPDIDSVRYIGRTFFDSSTNTCWMGLSGCGIEFFVSGGQCIIKIIADNMYDSPSHRARFAIYIDDLLVVDDLLDCPERSYFIGERNAQYKVRLIKISECAQSTVGVSCIEIEKGQRINPTNHKNKLIEFIGDSITCGYGVDVENPYAQFSTESEDVRKSFAYLTAVQMNCDYSMVSYSGYGIISGYTESDSPHPDILPPIYDSVGRSLGCLNEFSLSHKKWSFAVQPDLIIINLGTNDATYVKDDSARISAFVKGYVDFLFRVRSMNPKSTIVCTLGIMGDTLYPAVMKAANQFCAASGDTRVYCLRFDVQNPEDGYSAGWHPTYKTYAKASNKLVDFINNINW